MNSYNRHADHHAARMGRTDLSADLDRFAAHVAPGAWVADVGAGPGRYAIALAARGLRPIALDLSLSLLRAGRELGVTRRVQADLLALPFATGMLGGAWASASLLHLPSDDMPAALRELRRVVRSGGAAYISVKQGDGSSWESSAEGGARFFTYYRPAMLDNLLREAGWEPVAGWSAADATRSHVRWLARVCRAE